MARSCSARSAMYSRWRRIVSATDIPIRVQIVSGTREIAVRHETVGRVIPAAGPRSFAGSRRLRASDRIRPRHPGSDARSARTETRRRRWRRSTVCRAVDARAVGVRAALDGELGSIAGPWGRANCAGDELGSESVSPVIDREAQIHRRGGARTGAGAVAARVARMAWGESRRTRRSPEMRNIAPRDGNRGHAAAPGMLSRTVPEGLLRLWTIAPPPPFLARGNEAQTGGAMQATRMVKPSRAVPPAQAARRLVRRRVELTRCSRNEFSVPLTFSSESAKAAVVP
jgi:hypothetical protein